MKTFLFLFIFSINASIGFCQQNYFVYLQTDNKQSFYIKLNEQLYSSSASGYLVIPKLQNGSYNFSVGFPKAEWPQQMITVTINNKDEGYLLKNFNEKGWGLFNMQTLEVIMAKSGNDKKEAAVMNTNDGFSNILAGVVNTPNLNEKAVEKTNPVIVDTPAATLKPVSLEKTVEPLVINTASIKKLDSAIDNEGTTLVYMDKSMEKADTITIFIANESTVSAAVKKEEKKKEDTIVDSSVSEKPAVSNEAIVKTIVKEPTKEPDFIAIELPNPNSTRDTTTRVPPTQVTEKKEEPVIVPASPVSEIAKEGTGNPTVSIVNSDCKQSATDEDFLKLRKKMASYDKDEDMVNAARKSFKAKCYSTEQVKNLSVLFLTDAGKYSFFDIAYPFVHDSSRFGTLQSQLTDNYYINRFKAMVRQ